MQTVHKYFVFSLAMILFSCTMSFAQTGNEYVQYLKQRAKNGSATEQYILGRKYVQGNITDKSPSRGLYWLKKAAQNNYIPASLFLGEIYEQGIGTEKNYQKAVKWYRKAEEQGSESAGIKLSSITNKDPEKDFVLYGLSLQKANKLTVRYMLQDKGAEFLPRKSSELCDRFKTGNLVRGSDQVQACYSTENTENKVAYLEFRFPYSNGSSKHLQRIFQKLSKKYGEPDTPEEDSVQYIWEHRDVEIEFWYNAKYRTAFLRYSLPQRQKQFLKQLGQKNSTAK